MMVDTSGLFCLFDKKEPLHARSVAEFATARTRLIHNYVLAEFVPLVRSRGFDAVAGLNFAARVTVADDLTLVWVDSEIHDAAVQLLRERPDKNYSLCDAVSFVLMRRYNLRDALTTDRHFEQEGFARLLK